MLGPLFQLEFVINAITEITKTDAQSVIVQGLLTLIIASSVCNWRKIGTGARKQQTWGQCEWTSSTKGKNMDLEKRRGDSLQGENYISAIFNIEGSIWNAFVFENQSLYNFPFPMSQKPKNLAEDKQKIRGAKAKLQQMVYQTKKKILEGDVQSAYEDLYSFISQEKDKLGGDDSVFLLPGLFALAEIEIIKKRQKKAEEYLNAAHWSFLKSNDKLVNDKKKEKGIALTPEQQITTKINLHRTFAKLYECKGEYKQAINQLKQSIYLESTKWGPEHPYVAAHYFLMGRIFVVAGNQSVGEAFFAKVAEIWYRYLKNYRELSPEDQENFLLDQLSLEEAIKDLNFMERYFQESYDEQQVSVIFTPLVRTSYALAFLFKIFGDDSQYEGYLKQVYRKCLRYLPEDDRKTSRIKQILINLNVDLKEAEKQTMVKHHGDDLIQGGDDDDNEGLQPM